MGVLPSPAGRRFGPLPVAERQRDGVRRAGRSGATHGARLREHPGQGGERDAGPDRRRGQGDGRLRRPAERGAGQRPAGQLPVDPQEVQRLHFGRGRRRQSGGSRYPFDPRKGRP